MAAGEMNTGNVVLTPMYVVSTEPVPTCFNIRGRKKYRLKASSFSPAAVEVR